jgi:hypothetical protein
LSREHGRKSRHRRGDLSLEAIRANLVKRAKLKPSARQRSVQAAIGERQNAVTGRQQTLAFQDADLLS